MARAWEAVSSSHILEQSKLYRENITSNQISSQLKQLEDNQLVEIVEIQGKKKKLYRIRERFFNIWYLMRNGRKQNREQVLWLIRFLESWCTIEALQELAKKQMDGMECGKYSQKGAYYKAMALHHINSLDDNMKEELLRRTEEFLINSNQNSWAETIHNLVKSYDGKGYLQKALGAYESGDLKKAEELLLNAVKNNENDSENIIGLFYIDILKDWDKAEQYFLRAIKKGSINALNNIAGLYNDYKKNFAKAEEFYLEAIHNENVFALNNIGSLYRNEKHDYIKAEAHYLKAITKKLFLAIINLFSLYWYNMSKPEKSLFLCKQVFENEEWFRNESKGIVQLIMNLLLKQQYHFLLTEYQKENSLLQKYMQPIYYVVAWYLKDEMPGEYEKAGSEIKETVDEIIKTVNEMQKAEKDLLQETVS